MRGRSRMAALTLVAGLALAATVDVRGDGPKSKATAAVVNKVSLVLQITGLGPDGCEVEIRPGHPACDFKPIARKVNAFGQLSLPAVEVKSTSADRDCLFAITVKEPGKDSRTVKRGLQLNAEAPGQKAIPEQSLLCMIRSTSVAAAARGGSTMTVK